MTNTNEFDNHIGAIKKKYFIPKYGRIKVFFILINTKLYVSPKQFNKLINYKRPQTDVNLDSQ